VKLYFWDISATIAAKASKFDNTVTATILILASIAGVIIQTGKLH
jgi:hypothetical protein